MRVTASILPYCAAPQRDLDRAAGPAKVGIPAAHASGREPSGVRVDGLVLRGARVRGRLVFQPADLHSSSHSPSSERACRDGVKALGQDRVAQTSGYHAGWARTVTARSCFLADLLADRWPSSGSIYPLSWSYRERDV